MKKNNLLPLLILGIAASCSRKTPETLLSKWEKKVSSETSFERALASSSLKEKECLKDVFDVTTLKKEVSDLEKKFAAGEKVTGTWKHIDLSTLPIPQANFLKSYGSQIGDLKDPTSIDYSGCEDVPCLFNRIYKKENNVAGYVHYLWYLKFGHLLSADNLVPDQKSSTAGQYNDKEFALDAYLYSDKELFGLWRLSHMLKPPHTNLAYLKEMQRVPRGEPFEGRSMQTCGLASSAGWILLNDGCLTIYNDRMDTGYLYQAVAHEITHQVDFQQGRGTREFYRSHKKDYLDLIGMHLDEYVDDKGVQVRQWKLKPGAKLVSSYAGTLPQENFAETISLFRVEGDMVKSKTTDEHYAFVSTNFFDDKNFETPSLMNNWINSYAADTEREALRAVIDCSESKVSQKNAYFSLNDFTYKPSVSMLNCLGSKSEEIAETIRRKAALYEPEGCMALSNDTNKKVWNGHVKEKLKTIMNRYLQELEVDKDYIARIQGFYSDIDDRRVPKVAFVSCFEESNESECYRSELSLRVREQIASLKVSLEQEKELIDLYLSVHPYVDVSNEVKEGYKVFVSSNLEKIRYEAEDLWGSCKAIPHNDLESPRGSIFQVAEGYMISSFYNCLNSKAPEAIKHSVRSLEVDGAKIQNTKEELILYKEVQPHFVKMLQEKFDVASMNELNEIRKFIEEEDGSIRGRILSDFSWVKNVTKTEGVQTDCRAEALRLISFEPLYHVKGKIFSDLASSTICAGITTSSEYKKWLSESETVFKDMVINDLEKMLYTAGSSRARECLEKFPITNSVSKIKYRTQRDACLTEKWSDVENQVLNELKSNAYVEKFKFNLEDFRGELSKNSRRTQLKLIKENFN